ncbi:hypothetical protein C8R31_101367 [Nitrosospira sp. Nsp2]|nr:hypothetical protein C8R31_101367 [Nitrosospira sp. Nsp2]
MQTDGRRDDKEQGDIVGQQSRRERRSQNKKKDYRSTVGDQSGCIFSGVNKIKKEPK